MKNFMGRAARLIALAASVAAAAIAVGGDARAQWPERPITISVCFAAGGGTDIAIRLVTNELSQALGKPVLVENRAGASGLIATTTVARSAPDGYNLLGCSSAFVVNPSLYAQANYDPLKDFRPVMLLGTAPDVFVVPPNSDIKTFDDFVRKAKAAKGQLNWTSPGQGTTPYMIGELVRLRLGFEMQHIPFKGAGPAVQAAMAGQLDMMTANLSSVGAQLANGSLRAIAQTGKERWPDLKDVPTLEELGMKGAQSETFVGIIAPAATSQAVVDRLAKELSAILAREDIKQRYWKAGMLVLAEGPEEFAKRVAREVPFYKEIVDGAGLKVQ